jgi:spermidine synthase
MAAGARRMPPSGRDVARDWQDAGVQRGSGGSGSRVVVREDDGIAELALLRRSSPAGEVLELVVDGVFAMDTEQTDTERALAGLALDDLGGDGLHVVVGGLGLGYTTRTLLADPRVTRVDVVELHEPLVRWVRDGLVPPARGLLGDPRVHVQVGDVADVVPRLPRASVDALLLDVDNGPGFLVHPGNTRVYAAPFLTAAARVLRPGGVLGVWSAEASAELALVLERICGSCEEVLLDVDRDGRTFTYAVYLARVAG